MNRIVVSLVAPGHIAADLAAWRPDTRLTERLELAAHCHGNGWVE